MDRSSFASVRDLLASRIATRPVPPAIEVSAGRRFRSAQMKGACNVLIPVFGMNAADLALLLSQVDVLQAASMAFRPIFFGDASELGLFSRYDWVFDRFMGERDWARLHRAAGREWGVALRVRCDELCATYGAIVCEVPDPVDGNDAFVRALGGCFDVPAGAVDYALTIGAARSADDDYASDWRRFVRDVARREVGASICARCWGVEATVIRGRAGVVSVLGPGPDLHSDVALSFAREAARAGWSTVRLEDAARAEPVDFELGALALRDGLAERGYAIAFITGDVADPLVLARTYDLVVITDGAVARFAGRDACEASLEQLTPRSLADRALVRGAARALLELHRSAPRA